MNGLAEQEYRDKGYWKDYLLTDYLEQAVKSYPDKIAVKDNRFGALTYAELAQTALRLAAALQARGVGKGDRFVVALPNWQHMSAFVLALNYIGAVGVHLPITGGTHEFKGVIRASKAKGIVAPETFRGREFVSMIDAIARTSDALETRITVGAEQHHSGWFNFEELMVSAPGDEPSRVSVAANDFTSLLFTSGSSGVPKGVMHNSNTMGAVNVTVASFYGLGPDDVILMVVPLGFSAGMMHGVRLAIYLGATLILQETWNPEQALELITTENATFSLTTPTLLRDLLESNQLGKYAGNFPLKLMLCGGDFVSARLLRRANEVFPKTITTVLWGMTEGIGTACPLGTPIDRLTGTDGQAFPGTELRVLDENGKETGINEPGDLVMRGPQLFLGYFNQPNLNRESFLPGGWFRTGDIARIDKDGYIKIIGRRKDLIIRGGANISPTEIEKVLSVDNRIKQIVCVGIPDKRLGERVCACVIPEHGAENLTLEDLVSIAEQSGLAKYKWPQHLELMDSMPLTPSGKLQRSVLREHALKRLEAAGDPGQNIDIA